MNLPSTFHTKLKLSSAYFQSDDISSLSSNLLTFPLCATLSYRQCHVMLASNMLMSIQFHKTTASDPTDVAVGLFHQPVLH